MFIFRKVDDEVGSGLGSGLGSGGGLSPSNITTSLQRLKLFDRVSIQLGLALGLGLGLGKCSFLERLTTKKLPCRQVGGALGARELGGEGKRVRVRVTVEWSQG